MLITNLDVDKIVLTNVDSKTSIIELKVMFTNETPLKFTLQLEDDFNLLILKLIKRIKSLKIPQETDEDEILGGITVVNIKNEEDIKDRCPKRFFMLDQKLNNLKKTRDATNYMKLFSQISTIEEIIYSKENYK